MTTPSNFRFFLSMVLLAMTCMTLWQTIINQPPQIGEILAVERTEDSTEIQAVITAENAQIKLFFVKSIPFQRPARIDVIAKDTTGQPLPSTPNAVLKSIPDSLFVMYKLPYRHANELE